MGERTRIARRVVGERDRAGAFLTDGGVALYPIPRLPAVVGGGAGNRVRAARGASSGVVPAADSHAPTAQCGHRKPRVPFSPLPSHHDAKQSRGSVRRRFRGEPATALGENVPPQFSLTKRYRMMVIAALADCVVRRCLRTGRSRRAPVAGARTKPASGGTSRENALR